MLLDITLEEGIWMPGIYIMSRILPLTGVLIIGGRTNRCSTMCTQKYIDYWMLLLSYYGTTSSTGFVSFVHFVWLLLLLPMVLFGFDML